MVERFNGRISDILKDPSLPVGRGLEGDLASLRGLVQSSTAASRASRHPPLQAMKEWFKSNPELFHRRPYDRQGCDTYTAWRQNGTVTWRDICAGATAGFYASPMGRPFGKVGRFVIGGLGSST